MGPTVYVVCYHADDEVLIHGVFGTRERAEAALRMGDERSFIEERQLDPPPPEGSSEGQTFWTVVLSGDKAEVRRANGLRQGDVDEVDDFGDEQYVHLWASDGTQAMQRGLELIRRATGVVMGRKPVVVRAT